jgi:hypothetical protein
MTGKTTTTATTEDGEQRRVPLPPATVKGLLEHAERFGVDGVAEVAARTTGMDEERLTELIASLQRINETIRRDPKRKRMHWTRPTKVPADPGRWARALLGLPEPEDLTKPSRKSPARPGKVRATPKKEGRGRARPKAGGGARKAG